MKALTFLLFLTSAGLGGWAFWEHLERTRLEKEVAELAKERDALARTARLKTSLLAGMEVKGDGPTGLLDKLKDLGIPLEPEDKKEEKPKGKTPGEKDTAGALPDMMKMMRDPAMRDMVRAQTGAQIELQYRDLFDVMGLDDGKREKVLGLLKDRLSAQMDLGFKIPDKEMTGEQRKAAAADLEKATADVNARLKESLGDEYGKFERFEKSAPEREQLKLLNSMLKDKGLVLDEATETKLMDAMYNEREAFKFEEDLSGAAKLAPEAISREQMDRYLAQNAELQQKIQQRAKEILSAEQHEQFVKSQENQQQMMQLGLEMMRKMSGGETAPGGKD